jgi:hypothetical protein
VIQNPQCGSVGVRVILIDGGGDTMWTSKGSSIRPASRPLSRLFGFRSGCSGWEASPVWGVDTITWRLEPTFFSTARAAADRCVTIGESRQAPHRAVTRRWDEPKPEIGDSISREKGLAAWFSPLHEVR